MFVIDCVFFSPLIHVRFFVFVIVYDRYSVFLSWTEAAAVVVCGDLFFQLEFPVFVLWFTYP